MKGTLVPDKLPSDVGTLLTWHWTSSPHAVVPQLSDLCHEDRCCLRVERIKCVSTQLGALRKVPITSERLSVIAVVI